jgi:hypothetical protein
MQDPFTAPLPPAKKINPWIIIVAVVVILCCACFGLLGLVIAFGPDLLQELGLVLAPPGLISPML